MILFNQKTKYIIMGFSVDFIRSEKVELKYIYIYIYIYIVSEANFFIRNKYNCSGPQAFKSGSCRLRFS